MDDIDFKYAHGAILVSNIERSAQFYERAVGWKEEFSREFDESLGKANGYGGPGRIMMGKMGGVHLQLVQMQVPLERKERPKHFGIFLCSVIVKDLALGAELSKLESDRADHLQRQAEAQQKVPQAKLVDAVRAVLSRHGVK